MDTGAFKYAVSILRAAASIPATVSFNYRKGSNADEPREVQPYSLDQVENTLMLRGYQLKPNGGWRFYALDRMTQIKTGNKFEPIRKVTLSEDSQHSFSSKPVADKIGGYLDLLLAALADNQLSDGELQSLHDYRMQHKISLGEMRGVHYKIFADCLNAMNRDALIEAPELTELRELNACLKQCGGGILE